MDWKLLGLVSVVHAEGRDVSRSSAERAAGESIWVPTALIRPADAVWTVTAETRIGVAIEADGHAVRLEHELDTDGRIRSSRFERWGDPDATGTWGLHPFGVEVTDHRSFGGVTIPSAGRAGWHHGTARWDEGAFFRFEITDYDLIR